jgi:hypothetical protein
MTSYKNFGEHVPIESRLVILFAGLVLSVRDRDSWQQEWLSEIWHWHRETKGKLRYARWLLFKRSLGGFCDARCVLETQSTFWERVRDLGRSPITPVSLCFIAWFILLFSTQGLARTRALVQFLSNPRSDPLVIVTLPSPFFLVTEPVPASQAASWMKGAPGLDVVGRWKIERRSIEVNGQRAFKRVMVGDGVVLELLGFSASPRLAHLSRPSCELFLPTSFSVHGENWNEVTLDGQPCSVAFLKRTAEVPSPDFDAFVQMDDSEASVHEFGILAKRQPGVTLHQVQVALQVPVNMHPGWGNPEVSSLTQQISAIVKWIVTITLVSITLVLLRCSVKSVWGFLLLSVRAALLLSLPSAIYLEAVVARSHLVEAVGISPVVSLIGWFAPLLTCGALLYWLVRDHSLRCPVCQHCLAEPLWIGCLGKTIFEPFGTEWLCLAGHGRLLQSNSIALSQQGWLS